MPELPEVEITVRGLQKKILDRKVEDIWSDFKKIIKRPKDFERFRKELAGRKIKEIERRGKNILFRLSGGKTLLIHQKLTGHLLLGYWILDNGYWIAKTKGPLQEKINTYIHLLFTLDNGRQLALSDLRKFAKAELWDSQKLKESEEMKNLGPEPLAKEFTVEKFKEALEGKRGKIKQILMDQKVIAGIGNIYSDEILFASRIHPLRRAGTLKDQEIRLIHQNIKRILRKAIRYRGTTEQYYRDACGREGGYYRLLKVYQREGRKCLRCGAKIKRIKLGGRSAHFCPKCQQ